MIKEMYQALKEYGFLKSIAETIMFVMLLFEIYFILILIW